MTQATYKRVVLEIGGSSGGTASGTTYDNSTSGLTSTNVQDAIDEIASGGITGGLSYKGTWDANTNTPNIGGLTAENGDYYVVSVSGSTNLDGITDWAIGDWAIYNGTNWQKIDNSDIVTSVFGRTGVVTAQSGDYAASLITNDSSVLSGIGSVSDALNSLADRTVTIYQPQEVITLTITDITNKYIVLSDAPTNQSSTRLFIIGGSTQEYGIDFEMTTDDGGKRLSWNGLDLDGVLEIGDKIVVTVD